MLRVALVLDDYNELLYLQTILRKIGIDVEGLQNVKKYEELSLGFNPQVLIVSAFGKKVNGLEFVKGLHRVRGFPRVIVITAADQALTAAESAQVSVDQYLTSPVQPKNLIIALAQVSHVDEQSLLDKFEKLQQQGFGVDETIQLIGQEGDMPITGAIPRFSIRENTPSNAEPLNPKSSSFKLNKDAEPSPMLAGLGPERLLKYEQFLAHLEPLAQPKSTSFKRDRIFELNKKIRAATPPEDIKEVERDRQDFVRHLFTKK